jgi:hypothetical protein
MREVSLACVVHAEHTELARVTRIPRPTSDWPRALAEVELLAWLLDNSIPVPGTGGRRIGLDALVGFVPVIGDVVSGGVGLFIVWRGLRLGLPRVAVARMLANTALDLAVGVIPFAGDAFDLWFKANTRNLALMRRHLSDPGRSTREDWTALLAMLGAALLVVALISWLVISLLAALIAAI